MTETLEGQIKLSNSAIPNALLTGTKIAEGPPLYSLLFHNCEKAALGSSNVCPWNLRVAQGQCFSVSPFPCPLL